MQSALCTGPRVVDPTIAGPGQNTYKGTSKTGHKDQGAETVCALANEPPPCRPYSRRPHRSAEARTLRLSGARLSGTPAYFFHGYQRCTRLPLPPEPILAHAGAQGDRLLASTPCNVLSLSPPRTLWDAKCRWRLLACFFPFIAFIVLKEARGITERGYDVIVLRRGLWCASNLGWKHNVKHSCLLIG